MAQTLGLLMFNNVREQKKAKDMKATTPIAYPTGFMPLDFVNGQRVKVYDDDDECIEEYDSVGLVDGTMTAFIADPGLGKTTLSQQIAVAITSRYENAFTIHEDIEQSSHINRVINITGMKTKWVRNHYAIYQDTHAEQIVDRFLDHAKMKLNNRKEFEDNQSNLKDTYGAPIKKLIPTVVIIDSLAVMRSEDSSILEETKNMDGLDSATNNMAGARNAKFNSEMFKQILPWCKKANILLFVINQISRKISTGFLPPALILGSYIGDCI